MTPSPATSQTGSAARAAAVHPAEVLRLAELLESYPTVDDAFGAGDITREQAAIIIRAVEKVPASVDQTTHAA